MLFQHPSPRLMYGTHSLLIAGDHSFHWDGFSSTGNTVPSGTYFAQLALGKRKYTYKI